MKLVFQSSMVFLLLLLSVTNVFADEYQATVDIFKNAGESRAFFDTAYGYAVFPSVGKGGFIVGGAFGSGRVFVAEKPVGDASMTQLSVGFQAGGKAYSQIIFFQDERAFKEFSGGNYEIGANMQATVITAAATASATTAGSSAGISGGKHDATTVGRYNKGMAVFVVSKGGLMGEASVAGQKFSYTPRSY
ncbi:MAG: lipid-binding SYLF domain-containing protein [Gammaproteobacteria bacterium]|nr:lipid-binding SYLF domain-containing protein [Gammaproteobacteria bacterium]